MAIGRTNSSGVAKYTHPSYTAKSSGLYKVTVDGSGHVSATAAVTKSDITALGIPGEDTKYTHPSHTAKSSGLYKVTVDSLGHVSAATAVTKSDITALGIPGEDTNTTYSAATQSADGLQSAADKKKLDGIAEGANKYTHPSYTAKSSGLYKVTVDGSGHVSATAAVTKTDITALGIPDETHSHSADEITSGIMSTDRLPTVPVEKGGTGATTAAEARTSLGITPANIAAMPAIVATSNEYDMDTILTSGSHYALYKTNVSTLGTPYKKGVTTSSTALILSFASSIVFGTQIAICAGTATYIRYLENEVIGDWTELPTIVDSALSDTSTNPVQNKVINTALAGKAASSHNHSASDINSGTLAIARGGTGAGSASGALYNLIYGASEITEPAKGDYLGVHDASSATGAKVSIETLFNNLGTMGLATSVMKQGITGASEMAGTVAADADLIPITDASASNGVRKIQLSSLVTYFKNNITAADIGAATSGHTHSEYAPAYSYGTADLTAGTSELETGKLYFVYE